jgi:RNA polymerase sigma-70 factor (ECF subfamily)
MSLSADAHRRGRLDPAVERALRDRLCARDERALSELIALTSRWLLGVAAAVLGDRAAAEEVVMDVYRTAWERVTPSTDDSSSLLPWLLRITRNRAIDQLRARRRRPDAAYEQRRQDLADIEEIVAAPVHESEDHLLHARVQAALGQLPAAQREVMQLAFYRGLSHTEIAECIDAPLGTVKTRVRAAMTRLRDVLGDLRGIGS